MLSLRRYDDTPYSASKVVLHLGSAPHTTRIIIICITHHYPEPSLIILLLHVTL